MQPLKIGVFDSGVGGLAIYSEVRLVLPHASYVYYMDHEHFPYGLKDDDQVIQYALKAAERLVSEHQINLLVVACNTASTIALPHLRQLLGVPVVGVVPALKPAAQLSQSRTIGLLATPATIQRPYIDELWRLYGQGCRLLRVGSSALVELAEQKLRGEVVQVEQVAAEIAPLFTAPGTEAGALDHVVLGCTHFPLLLGELAQAARWPVVWLGSGAAVASRVRELAVKHELSSPAGGGSRLAIVTGPQAGPGLVATLNRYGFTLQPN